MTPEELRAIRADLGLNQTQMSELVGVPNQEMLSRYEAGARSIPGPLAVLYALLRDKPLARRWLEDVKRATRRARSRA